MVNVIYGKIINIRRKKPIFGDFVKRHFAVFFLGT